MKALRNRPINMYGNRLPGTSLFIVLVFFLFSGCSIWNGYRDPDYESTRADQLCHPYGQCSQGIWMAGEGTVEDVTVAKEQCQEAVDQHHGYEWWTDSVTRGLEIGRCMEDKGYMLRQ